ncbi:2-C-methyl-D-erythritol 2,4-cyclodiphosphate synthase [Castellaniella sp.]|uniref:2-C-methyl-D-erythritol 2,4-cyclodiphosphate synthase n=1 Tax=Castellaniella sp. TaxID=1955812 RepID=UPI00355D16A6
MESLIALVPAAGVGRRAGLQAPHPKQYHHLAGEPVLRHTVRALLADARIRQVWVAVAPDDTWVADALAGLPRTVWRACGGPTRADTVQALLAAAAPADADWVLVHDAARPALPADALARLIDTCLRAGRGGLLALPVADTVKQACPDSDGPIAEVACTRDRQGLWLAQTPQMFPAALLRRALQHTAGDPAITDEASAIERLASTGAPRPLLVPGSVANVKLTWPEDFDRLEASMTVSHHPEPGALPFRVGQGYDVHALAAGRPLIIGGVRIPHEKGLVGHSDADVLLHAITDALLGAAALGDIGRHFSDRDPRWAGADSRVFLREAARMIAAAGWRVANLDATIHAQAPRMGPHVPAMAEVLARDLAISVGQVNIKAKTNEGLGHLGRHEGIAATAVALLVRG